MRSLTTTRNFDHFTDPHDQRVKALALAEIATFKNHKVAIVTHAALAEHRPDLLLSHHEQKTAQPEHPEHVNIYELADGLLQGALLMSAAPEPIWPNSIKCTMPNGRIFCWQNSLQTIGGKTFPFSDIAPRWIGEQDAQYEIINQDAEWELAHFPRANGFAPGSILIVEVHERCVPRVVMAAEVVFTLEQIEAHLNWLTNPYWTMMPWTKLKGLRGINGHSWSFFNAHHGMRTMMARGQHSAVYVYIAA